MSYREHYAKPAAIQLYLRGGSRSEVVALLHREGAGSQAEELADEYYCNHLAVLDFHRKKKQKAAGMSITIGAVFIVLSLGYALLTYIALDSDSFIAPVGLFAFGVISLAKGMLDKRG